MHNVYIDNFDDFVSGECINDFTLYREKNIEWDSVVGKGAVKEICIRPGLSLIIENFSFIKPVSAVMELSHAPLEIFFCISGCLEGEFKDLNKSLKMDSGNASFFFTSLAGTGTIISAEEPLKLVTVRFDPEILCPAFCGLADVFPFPVEGGYRNAIEKSIVNNSPMTPEMKMVITQILSCKYKDAFRKVYLESKTIELITLYFAEINASSQRLIADRGIFNSSDIKKIHKAREILLEDIENPPLLTELAKNVGMNKDKLNHGFHKVFGTSVFSFFRNKKMEKARQVLEAGEMNVTETAYFVGYSQPGTFSRAFKQYYGINPKDYLKKANLEN